MSHAQFMARVVPGLAGTMGKAWYAIEINELPAFSGHIASRRILLSLSGFLTPVQRCPGIGRLLTLLDAAERRDSAIALVRLRHLENEY